MKALSRPLKKARPLSPFPTPFQPSLPTQNSNLCLFSVFPGLGCTNSLLAQGRTRTLFGSPREVRLPLYLLFYLPPPNHSHNYPLHWLSGYTDSSRTFFSHFFFSNTSPDLPLHLAPAIFLSFGTRYGQRDVKNISAYVGTRSPTQVRTHAQKYFLKQRREETAQMKSANTLARKRRLTMTTAAMEEDEEDEEDEEAEEDEEDDMELEKLGKASSLGNSGSGDLDRSGEDDFPGRRKSTRATNAAAVIKLRTQDFVAHTQASASPSGRVGSVKRSGTEEE